MKLTKKQKIGAGVLALAATAFGVDRVFLSPAGEEGQTEQAAAPAAAPRTADGSKSPEAATQRQQQQAAAALLAQRLNQVAAAEGLAVGKATDAFLPGGLVPAACTKPSAEMAAATAAPPPPDKAAMFRSSHKLTAVMRGGTPGQGVAVLTGPKGGVTARVGQAVDGFVLKTVRDNGVVMSNGKQDVVLELSKPGLTASASTAN